MYTRTCFLTFFSLIVSANFLLAQEKRITVQNPKEVTLILCDFYDLLPIEGYPGNDIIISSTAVEFSGTSERAKGLKAVYPSGIDNTGLGLTMTRDGKNIQFTCLLTKHKGIYKLKVPEDIILNIKSDGDHTNSLNIENMKNEIDADVAGAIKLKNVSGPLVLSTFNGNIEVVFDEISPKPISMVNVNGAIDVTIPAKSPVNLELSNLSGNIYSDFDLKSAEKKGQPNGANTINTKLNGGGTNMKFTNVNGNIYLRKG
jgi:hypothetical protein